MKKSTFFKDYCVPEYALRFAAKPGLRLDVSRLDLNVNIAKTEQNYITNWSLTNDLKIFLQLIKDMLKGKNY